MVKTNKVTNFSMTMNRAKNFVISNGRYMGNAPLNSCYYVKFPSPYSPKSIFAGDTHDLVTKVYEFGRTVEGRRLWNMIDVEKYNVAPPQEDDDIQEELFED